METDVLQFDCSRKFLRDLIFEKKRVGLRSLARRSGFRSPSILSLICTGKRRWTAESSERVANGLELKGQAREYFLQLTRLDRAPSLDVATQLHGRLLEIRRRRDESSLSSRQRSFLSQWYYPAILALLSTRDFRSDVQWIERRLGYRVSLGQIKAAVGDLINLDLVRYDEQRHLVPTEGPLFAGEDIPSLAIRNYHRNMIQLAEVALSLPLEKREITGLTVNVAERNVPAIKDRLRRFVKELNEELSAEPLSDQVYQLNLQFFPLTDVEKSA